MNIQVVDVWETFRTALIIIVGNGVGCVSGVIGNYVHTFCRIITFR